MSGFGMYVIKSNQIFTAIVPDQKEACRLRQMR